MSNVAHKQELSIKQYVESVALQAAAVRSEIAAASSDQKNKALKCIAEEILDSRAILKEKNQLDLKAGKERGLDNALLDRLELTDARIEAMGSVKVVYR